MAAPACEASELCAYVARPLRLRLVMAVLAGTVLAAAACSPQRSASDGASTAAETTPSTSENVPTTPTVTGQPDTSTNPGRSPAAASGDVTEIPAGTPNPRAQGTLTPNCVMRGQAMQLSVQVEKYTALVYVAHYANGESGAEKPWGDGHGGNGGGMADENTGQYSDQWLVKPSAPAGPGWVQVEIAYPRPDDRETLILPFSVAGKSGTC